MSETVLKLDNVNLTLGSGATQVHVLKGVSIALEKGESVGIVGPSGSGKTSLLMVLSGLERADSGSIKVNGTELTKLSEDALARLQPLMPAEGCNGYWHGKPGLDQVAAAAAIA